MLLKTEVHRERVCSKLSTKASSGIECLMSCSNVL